MVKHVGKYAMPSHGSVIRVLQSLQGGRSEKHVFFFCFWRKWLVQPSPGWRLVESLENGKTYGIPLKRPAAARPAISWLVGWAFGKVAPLRFPWNRRWKFPGFERCFSHGCKAGNHRYVRRGKMRKPFHSFLAFCYLLAGSTILVAIFWTNQKKTTSANKFKLATKNKKLPGCWYFVASERWCNCPSSSCVTWSIKEPSIRGQTRPQSGKRTSF